MTIMQEFNKTIARWRRQQRRNSGAKIIYWRHTYGLKLKMNKLIKHFLSVIILFAPLTLLAHAGSAIHTIKSMQEMEKYIDAYTIVLFDLDHTIFESKNYGYGHLNWFYDEVEKGTAKGQNEKAIIFNLFPHWLVSQQNMQVKPVEEITPHLIKKLQHKGLMVIGVTARQVPLVDLTLNHLKEINIDFSSKKLPDVIIYGFQAPTEMKSGIIFCSEYNSKGKILKAYLDKQNIFPKKIVFVDDSIRHLHAVTKVYSEVEVIGLHYPLVAEYKQKHWDKASAHNAYCDVAKNHPELNDYPLNCA